MINDNASNLQNKPNDDDYIVPMAPTGPFEPMPMTPLQTPKKDKTKPIDKPSTY